MICSAVQAVASDKSQQVMRGRQKSLGTEPLEKLIHNTNIQMAKTTPTKILAVRIIYGSIAGDNAP